jgi:hypothetical protein
MKERPILFSGPMVRAILDGRKTQTRRLVKPQPEEFDGAGVSANYGTAGEPWWVAVPSIEHYSRCPYGQPGDRLWVRETFGYCKHMPGKNGKGLEYRADGVRRYFDGLPVPKDGFAFGFPESKVFRWKPSIHMPRWASRLDLEVTDVRVERVQDISEADACHEGAPAIVGRNIGPVTYREGFRELWDSINFKRGYGWDANPWCWCISFKVV